MARAQVIRIELEARNARSTPERLSIFRVELVVRAGFAIVVGAVKLVLLCVRLLDVEFQDFAGQDASLVSDCISPVFALSLKLRARVRNVVKVGIALNTLVVRALGFIIILDTTNTGGVTISLIRCEVAAIRNIFTPVVGRQ